MNTTGRLTRPRWPNLRCLSLALLLFVPGLVYSQRIELGHEDRWGDIANSERVTIVSGKRGETDLTIEESGLEVGRSTDFLLNFESGWNDVSGTYRVLSAGALIHERAAKRGVGGGVLTGGSDGVRFEPSRFALFGANQSWDDFSIEFWLFPARLRDGSEILRWQNSQSTDSTTFGKELRVFLLDRKIHWRFDGIFTTPEFFGVEIELVGREILLPRRWQHHLLRYEGDTGLAEYLVDGVSVSITHATASGHEESQAYDANTGNGTEAELIVGRNLTGFIDELRFARRFVDIPNLQRFTGNASRATTRVFDLGYSNSQLTSIDSHYTEAANSAARFFYRLNDRLINADEVAGNWIQFLPGEGLGGLYGRYVQLAFELFPSGSGDAAPRIHSVSIEYEPDRPPHPPEDFRVVAGDGKLTLRWSRSLDLDVAGYLVFYGDRSARYFGEASLEGISPVDVGNVEEFTLSGLENGRLYYLALAAYDASLPPHQSVFTEERSVRPTRLSRSE